MVGFSESGGMAVGSGRLQMANSALRACASRNGWIWMAD